MDAQVKPTTKFAKIYSAVSEKKGMPPNSFRLLYDGDRLNEDKTIAEYEMEDGDVIDLFVEAVGGRC